MPPFFFWLDMPSDAETIRAELLEQAAQAQSMSSGGRSVTQRSIKDLIEAEKHLAAQESTGQTHFGLRFTKLVPPECG